MAVLPPDGFRSDTGSLRDLDDLSASAFADVITLADFAQAWSLRITRAAGGMNDLLMLFTDKGRNMRGGFDPRWYIARWFHDPPRQVRTCSPRNRTASTASDQARITFPNEIQNMLRPITLGADNNTPTTGARLFGILPRLVASFPVQMISTPANPADFLRHMRTGFTRSPRPDRSVRLTSFFRESINRTIRRHMVCLMRSVDSIALDLLFAIKLLTLPW